MAGASVTLNWGGLDKAVGGAALHLRGSHKALLTEVGEAMVSGTLQRFQDGVDPEGQPWEPSHRALADGGKTLVDSAALQNSIAALATASAVYVGSNLVYSRIHQEGGKARATVQSGGFGWRRADFKRGWLHCLSLHTCSRCRCSTSSTPTIAPFLPPPR